MARGELVVQKFGGTSVDGPERLRAVAARVIKSWKAGTRVVVVVSAPGDMTDHLLEQAGKVSPEPSAREVDMLLATGEQQSIALMAMAISSLGQPALSLTGHQVGILTDEVHNQARIVTLGLDRVRRALKEGRIPVVAGFQGINEIGDLTTLGRGGSDLTAVALAVGLKADRCELYKDVTGIYTADPRIEPRAGKIDSLTYEEMLELASLGASVIHARSVELAGRYGVPLVIRSSFTTEEGTTVGKDSAKLERVVVRGVTLDRNEAKVTLRNVPDRPGVAARVFDAVARAHVNVDMIVQNISAKGSTDLSFTVPQGSLSKVRKALGSLAKSLGVPLEEDDGIAKVSIVGVGMRSHSGVAARAFSALGKAGINIQMITTSEIRISCAVSRQDAEPAVRALHRAFSLGKGRSK